MKSTIPPQYSGRPAPRTSNGTSHGPAAPWVLISGGFHRHGGMDKANLALADYLVEQGSPVHVVCHSIDADLAQHPLVTVHNVARPAGSFFLGRPLLDFRGRRIAARVLNQWPEARVVVNGENCLWPDINWVHCVHHAWGPGHPAGPPWFRAKHALSRWNVQKRERSAARIGRIFIANSERTRRDLIELLGVPADRAHTVYLGAESEWGPATSEHRAAARRQLAIPEGRPIVVFLGAFGFDRNKGFDILLEAWRRLSKDPRWDAELLMAGSGGALEECRKQVNQHNLQGNVRFVGFSKNVATLLAASNVLVSPVRYEAYGLNVQEAICCGIPAIVSAGAGVAERYGAECAPLLLRNPEDVAELVSKLWDWRRNERQWEMRFLKLGETLRQYGWKDMARSIVSIANGQVASEPSPSDPAPVLGAVSGA